MTTSVVLILSIGTRWFAGHASRAHRGSAHALCGRCEAGRSLRRELSFAFKNLIITA